jgi:hypothetical protein
VSAVVDNENKFYCLRASFGTNNATLGIVAVQIAYTVSQAD